MPPNLGVSTNLGFGNGSVPFQTKYGLNYSLLIEDATGASLTVAYPFTLEFEATRNNYAATNTGQFRIYNLNENHRNFLLHDQYDISVNHALYMTLQAGYGPGPNWPVIFKGDVNRGYSLREKNNFVTTLEAFDGGLAYANARSSFQYPAGTTQLAVITALIQDLAPYGVRLGAISAALGGVLQKGGAYSGNTLDILRDLTNGNYFIDNLTMNCLVPGDALATITPLVIDASFGLLETPLKEKQYLEVTMLFEPRVTIGTVVNLQSRTAKTYNGLHQVIGIKHRGTISGAVADRTVTTVSLQSGTFNQITGRVGI